jgi:branched-chain amino acid transport system ATP-binding protein
MLVDVLDVDDVSLRFGGLRVLDEVSLRVGEGEAVAVIGPNGAGKTALLNCISGTYRPQDGAIRLAGQEITGKAPHKVVRLGVARTFQAARMFGALPVLDNVLAGRYPFGRTGVLRGLAYYPWSRREEAEQRRVAEQVIEQLGLQEYRRVRAADLPYGLRKRVDLARAVALEPKVLLLDEPMAGLNPEERTELTRYLRALNRHRGIPLLLVEHDMAIIRAVATRVIVLNFGVVIAHGSPAEVSAEPMVIEAYLGRQGAA